MINGNPLTREQKINIIIGKVRYLLEDAKYYEMHDIIIRKIENLVEIIEIYQNLHQKNDDISSYFEDNDALNK